MLLTKNKLAAFSIFLWCTVQFSCTRNWEDHNNINDDNLTQNLYEKIAGDPALSKFTGYLQKTGYADTLQSTRSFTVWAPTNDALQSIDATIGNDDNKLKRFVAHHIAHLSYYSDKLTGGVQRLPLIDGKYGIVKTSTFEDAPIITKDLPANNGVLHTITAAAAPVGNCWDYVDSLNAGGNFMANFLKNYVSRRRDTTNAIQIGINPLTGAPIYQPGTDTVIRPVFIDQVYDIANEAKEYTVFIMDNPTWSKERSKLDTFYRTSSADTTYNLARFFTAKDMAVEGALSPEQLPDSILSKFGVWVPINKSAIRAKYHTSNGYVYVMSEMNVLLRQRFPPLIVQGESYIGTSNNSYSPIYLRSLINPNNGQSFNDLYVYSPGVAKWNVRYRLYNVPTTRFRVYWATYNNRWNNTLNQRLAMGTADNTTSFPYRNVPYGVYKVDSLGEYPVTSFGNGYLDIYLVNADLAPSSSNQSQTAMFLDYIRLEPVYKQN